MEIAGTLIPPKTTPAPSSPVKGQLYYDTAQDKLFWWNGTSWIAASGAAEVYEQPGQPASTTVGAIWIDTDDVPPVWSAGIPLVTSLPSSPVDGSEVYFVADATNGVIWHLRYRAGSASAYKWECLGGTPIVVSASNSLGSNGGVAPFATPVLTYPRAGDYLVGGSVFASMSPNVAVGLQWAVLIVDGSNSVAYGIDWQANYNLYSSPNQGYANRMVIPEMPKAGLAAGATAKLLPSVSGYDYNALHREIRAMPVRVG